VRLQELQAAPQPKTMRDCHSYMDPSRARRDERQPHGRLLQKHKKVFTIGDHGDNAMFDRPLGFLAKNEDDLTGTERAALKALVFTLDKLRSRHVRPSSRRCPHRTASPASSPARPRPCTSTRSPRATSSTSSDQRSGDILVTGVPYISPYNVNSFLNPLLVQVMCRATCSTSTGRALVKGGTMIFTHSCTDQFDKTSRSLHRVRAQPAPRDARRRRAAQALRKEVRQQPGLHPDVPHRQRVPPSHPFFMWYWGEPAVSGWAASSASAPTTNTSPSSWLGDRAHDARGALDGGGYRAQEPGHHHAARGADDDGGVHA